MTVRDLIAKLQQFDPDLPVCVSDWFEGASCPSEEEGESVTVVTDVYRTTRAKGQKAVEGPFVRLGTDLVG